ncbi:MAG: fasciclin domain-containing protein [Flavobacteriaceae bacterium]
MASSLFYSEFKQKYINMKNLILSMTALFLMLSVSSQTIVDTAVSNKDFSTLVTALKAADLVGALSGEGPFTVFAPNNAAFGKIDSETLGSLLKPENVKALSNILTYHVVSGKLMASDVTKALKNGYGRTKLTALNGQTFVARSKDGKIFLKDQNGNMSQIIATDVVGTNGVIHVIDTVIMPE